VHWLRWPLLYSTWTHHADYAPWRVEKRILNKFHSHRRWEKARVIRRNILQKGPLSKAKISRNLGHKHISGGLKKILYKLLQKGIITYTIPEKSNSRLQKYKLKN